VRSKRIMNEDRIFKKFQTAVSALPLERYREMKENLLVLSPHPDDDVLGAGGTMALASERGQGVFAVYVTDGRGSPQKDPRITAEEMAARRGKEALASLKAIGAAGGFFLGHRSGDLGTAAGAEVRKELTEILILLKPAEVYLPAPYERHRTHQVCTALTLEALRSAGEWPLKVYGYSLWGSFWGGKERIVRDIGSVIRKKVEAVNAHASQIEYKNYHQGILGKNNWEAVFWESHEIQKASFVEIFLNMTEFLFRKDLSVKTFIQEDFEEFQTAFMDVSWRS
jgi:LmbE family N-acetylglucosaminyl deacetylase